MEDGFTRLVAAPLSGQRVFHCVVGVERMLSQIHDGQGLRLGQHLLSKPFPIPTLILWPDVVIHALQLAKQFEGGRQSLVSIRLPEILA